MKMPRLKRPRTDVKRMATWPAVALTLPAFVAIWGGWVGLGEMTGFGPIHPLPGIADDLVVNTAITLPIGLEVYAAYALNVALSAHMSRTRKVAALSSVAALLLGMFGQACYHVLESKGVETAGTGLVIFVSCLPILVLGAGSFLAHLVRLDNEQRLSAVQVEPEHAQVALTPDLSALTPEIEQVEQPEPEPERSPLEMSASERQGLELLERYGKILPPQRQIVSDLNWSAGKVNAAAKAHRVLVSQ